MRVGVIVPTRGDRPLFLQNCKRLISNQTLKPTEVLFVDFKPINSQKDITKRYRFGYDYFRNKGLDVIALMEDDEWYHPEYLERMTSQWDKSGRPDLLGTNYTIYYHVRLFKYFIMRHTRRSVAMSTLIKPDMNFNWCPDTEAYTDSHLWFAAKHQYGKKLTGIVWAPPFHLCLGIKHGVGLTGGSNHTTDLHRYNRPGSFNDSECLFLKKTVDSISFEFYKNQLFDSKNFELRTQ
jgi:glycosyltransferase involved in cell wall biosynthesis